jgi:hypothetical protein
VKRVARLLTACPAALVLVSISVSACATEQAALRLHQEKLESLGSSSAAVAEAWLGGSVQGPYARTAVEQIYQLAERERSRLAGRPEMLADADGARLSEAAEHLSRVLALMIRDIERRDAAALRRHVTQIPTRPPS